MAHFLKKVYFLFLSKIQFRFVRKLGQPLIKDRAKILSHALKKTSF